MKKSLNNVRLYVQYFGIYIIFLEYKKLLGLFQALLKIPFLQDFEPIF